MSLRDGMAAINLEMPDRIPRTEASADFHYPLIRAVTGIDVSYDSPPELRSKASRAFIKAWNYDFIWSTTIGGEIFGKYRVSMGHAVYAEGGTDWNPNLGGYFKTPEQVLAFDPYAVFGQIDRAAVLKRFNDNYADLCGNFDECVNMAGVYTTCISGLIDMFGWELLLEAAGLDPAAFGRLIRSYGRYILQYFEVMAQCDAPVLMVHDDMVWTNGPFMHPDYYRQYVFPTIKSCIDPLREAGKKVIFTSDGNFTCFANDIANCGASGFCFEPTTSLEYIAEKYGKTHVIIGNADTRILLMGSRGEIREEVRRCMDIGRKCPGFFMMVGNHIPPNTPVDACLWYNEFYEEMSLR